MINLVVSRSLTAFTTDIAEVGFPWINLELKGRGKKHAFGSLVKTEFLPLAHLQMGRSGQ